MGPFSATDRLDGRLVNELARFGGLVRACFQLFPVDFHADGFENALGGCRNLGTNAFSGDQSDFVSHGCIVLYAKALKLSKWAW
jgi:hypothetical protein